MIRPRGETSLDENRPGASQDAAEDSDVIELPVRLFAPGTDIGHRYRIRSVLGVSDSAVVYEAFDRDLRLRVALKVLRADGTSEAALQSLRREAATVRDAASVRLARVFEIEQSGGTIFVTSELVEGESLRELLARGPLSPGRAAEIAAEMFRALVELHALGIVHRNLKPGNVLLSGSGEVKLTDFGLARRREGGTERERESETVAGTVEYLSPEQALGQPLDPRSDLYSAGVVLFEMLTGRVPLRGDSAIGTIVAHLREFPPDVRTLRRQVPAWQALLTARLLEKDKSRRHACAFDVLADLETQRARRAPRQGRRALVLGSCAALVGAVVALVSVPGLPWNRPRLSRLVAGGSGDVRAVDGDGRVLWRRAFLEVGRSIALVRGPGGETIPIAVCGDPTQPRKTLELLAPATGAVIQRVALPDPSVAFPLSRGSFDAASVLGADVDGDGTDEVAISLRHVPLSTGAAGATFVCDLDPPRLLLAFFGSGPHDVRAAADLDRDGRDELILVGRNDRMGRCGAVAALRLPRDGEGGTADGLVTAESPDRPGAGSPSRALGWYALVPSSELLGNSLARVDLIDRVVRIEGSGRPPWEVAFDGLPQGPRDATTSRERTAVREEGYALLREESRLRGAGFPDEALVVAQKAVDRARAAGDATLAGWASRVHAAALLDTRHPEEADTIWGSLFARTQEPAVMALEAGRAFHLKGDLPRAVAWYRRGLAKPEARTRPGSDPCDLAVGEVLALGEEGRWEDAAVEIDRFEASYPDLVLDTTALRAYVAWRTLRRPRLFGDGVSRPALYRYWHLEVRRELGEPPRVLLAEAERLARETEGLGELLMSLRAELLCDAGRAVEGKLLSAEAVAAATRAATSNVGVRAHLNLVVERARRHGALVPALPFRIGRGG